MERRVIPIQPFPLDVNTVLMSTYSLSALMIEFKRRRDVFDDLRYCWVLESSWGEFTSSRADTYIPVSMIWRSVAWRYRCIQWLDILLFMIRETNVPYSFWVSLLAATLRFGIIPPLQNIHRKHSGSGKVDNIACGVEAFVSSENGSTTSCSGVCC